VQSGYTVAEAGLFLSMGGVGGLAGKAGIAWLGDAGRAYARWIAAGLLLVQAGGICLLLVAGSSAAIFPAVCMIGFAAGGFIPMHPYLNSRYFDAANIGHVNGAQAPLFLPFGLVGAPLAGYAYDTLGNYQLVFVCLAVVLVLAAGLVLALPPTRRETRCAEGVSAP
jgi:cyanate permease